MSCSGKNINTVNWYFWLWRNERIWNENTNNWKWTCIYVHSLAYRHAHGHAYTYLPWNLLYSVPYVCSICRYGRQFLLKLLATFTFKLQCLLSLIFSYTFIALLYNCLCYCSHPWWCSKLVVDVFLFTWRGIVTDVNHVRKKVIMFYLVDLLHLSIIFLWNILGHTAIY